MERGYGNLVRHFDPDGRFFEGTTLRQDRIMAYAAGAGIAWSRTPTGRLSTADDTLARREAADPELGRLRTLMAIRDDFKGFDLDVGRDGRLRFDARPFWSCTGRCQPAGNKTPFSKDAYLRGLVVAPAGRCLLYVDYRAEEIGVAAYLSGDRMMIELYEAEGDIYLRFGAMAGLIPVGATKETHGAYRKRVLKPLVLGTQYGMRERTFAARASVGVPEARRLLRVHQELFSGFWAWAAGNQERFSVQGRLYTPMRDWYVRFHPGAKPTTLLNWPMQAGSGDILRRAVHALHRDGVCVLATLHGAVLVECDEAELADCERLVVARMEQDSREVLGGRTIPAEVSIRAAGRAALRGRRRREEGPGRVGADDGPPGRRMIPTGGE